MPILVFILNTRRVGCIVFYDGYISIVTFTAETLYKLIGFIPH